MILEFLLNFQRNLREFYIRMMCNPITKEAPFDFLF